MMRSSVEDIAQFESVESSEQISEQISKELTTLSNAIIDTQRETLSTLEIPKDPRVVKLTQKIIETSLRNKPEIEEQLKKLNLHDYIDNISSKHPELRSFITFDLGLQKIKNKKYENLDVYDKLKLLALKESLGKSSWYEKKTKDDRGNYAIGAFQEKYRRNFTNIISSLALTFKINQLKNFGFMKKTLIQEYGADESTADLYIKYLEDIKKQIEAKQPQEAGARGYVIVALLAALLGAMGMKMYQDFMNGGKETLIIGRIQLGDIEAISKLVTAEQSFSTTSKTTKKQFSDDTRYGQMGNIAQTKEVTISLDGKIGVEYDLSSENGAEFIYNAETKMIEINLSEPKLSIRESDAKILDKNNPIFDTSNFNDIELNLIKSMKENTLNNTDEKKKLINLSMESAASIIYSLYAPIIESNLVQNGSLSVQGVIVTINSGDTNERLQQNFSKDKLKRLKD